MIRYQQTRAATAHIAALTLSALAQAVMDGHCIHISAPTFVPVSPRDDQPAPLALASMPAKVKADLSGSAQAAELRRAGTRLLAAAAHNIEAEADAPAQARLQRAQQSLDRHARHLGMLDEWGSEAPEEKPRKGKQTARPLTQQEQEAEQSLSSARRYAAWLDRHLPETAEAHAASVARTRDLLKRGHHLEQRLAGRRSASRNKRRPQPTPEHLEAREQLKQMDACPTTCGACTRCDLAARVRAEQLRVSAWLDSTATPEESRLTVALSYLRRRLRQTRDRLEAQIEARANLEQQADQGTHRRAVTHAEARRRAMAPATLTRPPTGRVYRVRLPETRIALPNALWHLPAQTLELRVSDLTQEQMNALQTLQAQTRSPVQWDGPTPRPKSKASAAAWQPLLDALPAPAVVRG